MQSRGGAPRGVRVVRPVMALLPLCPAWWLCRRWLCDVSDDVEGYINKLSCLCSFAVVCSIRTNCLFDYEQIRLRNNLSRKRQHTQPENDGLDLAFTTIAVRCASGGPWPPLDARAFAGELVDCLVSCRRTQIARIRARTRHTCGSKSYVMHGQLFRWGAAGDA